MPERGSGIGKGLVRRRLWSLAAGALIVAPLVASRPVLAHAQPLLYGPVHFGQSLLVLLRDAVGRRGGVTWTAHLCEAGTPMLDSASVAYGDAAGPRDTPAPFDTREAPIRAALPHAAPRHSHVWVRLRMLDGSMVERTWALAAGQPPSISTTPGDDRMMPSSCGPRRVALRAAAVVGMLASVAASAQDAAPRQLDAVTVTGSRAPRALSDVPTSVSQVEVEELQQQLRLQELGKLLIGKTAIETLSCDLKVELASQAHLKEAIAHCESVRDYVSREILEHNLGDTEQHIDYLETQLNLVAQVGELNWLQSQMGDGPAS